MKGQGRIPGAIENVVAVGTIAELGHGLSGSVRLRHFGAAVLTESYSQRLGSTTLVNQGFYNRTGRAGLGSTR